MSGVITGTIDRDSNVTEVNNNYLNSLLGVAPKEKTMQYFSIRQF